MDKLKPSDPTPHARFSYCDISGNVAVIGAPGHSPPDLEYAGAGYVFELDAGVWHETAKLTANDTAAEDRVGESVAIEGDVIILGAPYRSTGGKWFSGSAYVFERIDGNWVNVTRLDASDVSITAEFGKDVDISNGVIAVGAPFAKEGDEQVGAVYLFKKINGNWVQTQRISAPDVEAGGRFGAALDIEGDRLIVGATGVDGAAASGGAAYVFERTDADFEFDARLVPASGARPSDGYGRSVAFHGDSVVVSAIGYDALPISVEAGAAFIHEKIDGTWTETAVLMPPTNWSAVHMGEEIAVRDDGALAISTALSPKGECGGFVLFQQIQGEWMATNWITHDEPESGDYLLVGAWSGDWILAGAWGDDDDGDQAGAVYVFRFDTASLDCDADGIADDCAIGASLVLDCDGNGVPDDCDIADQPEIDCNGNGIPDVCDIAAWLEMDCNANDLPDACEIASGANCDADGNGVPDDCDADAHLQSSTGGSVAGLGYSVAIEADLAVSSNQYYQESTWRSGIVYLYERPSGQWEETVTLFPSPSTGDKRFGASVAIDDGRIIVGDPEDSTPSSTGSASIFENIDGAWQRTGYLFAEVAVYLDGFGETVDLDGGTAIVGAPSRDFLQDESGTLYVFDETAGNWSQTALLKAPGEDHRDLFGVSAEVSGDTIAVGAPLRYTNDIYSGTTFIYTRQDASWILTATITLNAPERARGFGYGVALDNDLLVVGAPSKSSGGYQPGSVFVFRRSGEAWTQEAKLQSPRPTKNDYFGKSVAIVENRIVVGCTLDDTVGEDAGAVYLYEYRNGSWELTGARYPTPGSEDSQFGASVSATATDCFVGAPAEVGPEAYGAAYLFRLASDSSDCNDNNIPDDCEAPLGSIEGFVTAVLDASDAAFDVCVYDADSNGLLDGRDVALFAADLLGE